MSDKKTDTSTKSSGGHTAGAFDIRNIIGALLGIYGVLLLLAGLFMDTEEAKTGGVNANLWTGLALAVAGAVFLLWARLKPIIVPPDVERVDDDPTRPAPRRRPGGH
ncbi:hypothetical protein [Pedococcus sp. P5_B7]